MPAKKKKVDAKIIEGFCYMDVDNGGTIKADLDKYEILNSHCWHCTKGRLPYALIDNRKIPVVKILYPSIVLHGYKNGNKLDLTKNNVIETNRDCYIEGDTCFIPLVSGDIATCDIEHFNFVKQYSWYQTSTGLPVSRDGNTRFSLLAIAFPNILIPIFIDGNRLNFKSNNVINNIRKCYIEENICYIPMTNGDIAITDAHHFEKVSKYNWSKNKNGYASANYKEVRNLELHKFLHPEYKICDHTNRNKFDNRDCNLREVTKSQSCQNRNRFSNNTTGYKGVSFDKSKGKFSANIGFNGKYISLGVYSSAEKAARVYDLKAKELHGEYAVLNFPSE